MKKTTILIPGGDLRYDYTAAALSDTYEVHREDDLEAYDTLLLPIGTAPEPALLHKIKPGGIVLHGNSELPALPQAEAVSYLECEELAVRNAVPTAEGALRILLEELPVTIAGSSILVLGFGRIGMRLTASLTALGARVTVAARRAADRAKAEQNAWRSIPFSALPEAAAEAAALCNTVPAPVIGRSVLERIPQGSLILDLASRPGGVDWEAAKALNRRVVWALSLPGKTAPVTAGEIIAITVRRMLEERGERL